MNKHGIGDGDWKSLLEHRGQGSVSIFMPTYRPMGDGRQDPIRLRNLLREAENLLVTQLDFEPEQAAQMLKDARLLNEDDRFWKKQRKGLALFCSPGLSRAHHLPIEVKEHLTVADRFYLRPLMPLQQTHSRFYVLALSLNQVRLLEGWRDEIRRVDLEGVVPTSIDDALGYEVVQMHSTSTSSGFGHQRGMVHGHGDSDQEKHKKDVLHYFQLLAKGLPQVLADKTAPLVLATVQEHFSLFRSAHRHPRLIDSCIAGNPDAASDHQLHERAWEVVEPWLLREHDRALERYGELKASGRATSVLEDLVRAADEGRVDVLLLAETPERWGTYDRERAKVNLHAEAQAGDEDLLDRAAVATLKRGGSVFTVAPERLPDGGSAAAVYRY